MFLVLNWYPKKWRESETILIEESIVLDSILNSDR